MYAIIFYGMNYKSFNVYKQLIAKTKHYLNLGN